MALTPRRRWCCRFCVLSERTGAVRIVSGEIDRCRCRRRRAQSRSPEPAVLPRFPARNYCHRPSYNGPLPPPPATDRPTDQPPVIKTSSVLVFSNSAQCPSIVPPLCLTRVFKMFLIFKNHPNVCLWRCIIVFWYNRHSHYHNAQFLNPEQSQIVFTRCPMSVCLYLSTIILY